MRPSDTRRAPWLWAGLLWALPLPLYAGLTTAPGTSAAAFLDLGYGARAIGMGEAFVSVADDAEAMHYNPAGLAYPAFTIDVKRAGKPYEMMLSESLLVQDVQMTQVGLLRRPYGFSFTRLNLGGIEARTAETTQADSTIGAADMALAFSAARRVGGVGLGASGRFIQESIGSNSANAFALDLGALRRFEGAPVSVGVSLANLGTKMRFIEQSAPLPLTLRTGVTYGLTRSFPHAITLEVDAPRDDSPVVRFGAEYAGFGPLALRFGWRSNTSTQRTAALGKNIGTTASGLSDFYGMSMGAGLRTQYGDFDYAIVPYGELGTAQRFAYSYAFGGSK
ncbi:MAG: PorV/PorQ family protein [Elusimicrobia bacterium]|nr:PorV/PorQ family protein [Elusimicrobiota bacterium]